jgi:signal peptidase I
MTMTIPIRLQRIFRDWFPTVLLLVLLLAARSTLADHYHVPTGSMEHTLRPGDHVLVNKAAYGWRIPFTGKVVAGAELPERGEVVVFDSPENGKRLIKRVVAVAGDTVAVKAGLVYINGHKLLTGHASLAEHYGAVARTWHRRTFHTEWFWFWAIFVVTATTAAISAWWRLRIFTGGLQKYFSDGTMVSAG